MATQESVNERRTLGSPFQSPKLSSGSSFNKSSSYEEILSSPLLWNVSLPQIEIHNSQNHHLTESADRTILASSSSALYAPSDNGKLPKRRPRISFGIAHTGEAVLKTTTDPMFTTLPSERIYEPHSSEVNYLLHHGKLFHSDTLSFSTSPEITEKTEKTDKVLDSDSYQWAGATLTSSSPIRAVPPAPIREEEDYQQQPVAVKRAHDDNEKHQEDSSGIKGRKKYAMYPQKRFRLTPVLASVPDMEFNGPLVVEDLESAGTINLSTTDQVSQLLFRALERARNTKSSSAQAKAKPSEAVYRPKDAALIHGKQRRVEVLAERFGKGIPRVRGNLRCSSECDEAFHSYEDFAAHLDTVHGLSARPYECPHKNCVWSVIGFINGAECARHIRSSHSAKSLICELCELQNKKRAFSRSDALRRHIAIVHTHAGIIEDDSN